MKGRSFGVVVILHLRIVTCLCHVIHVEALGALQKLGDLLAEDERVDAHTAQCCLVVPVIPQMSIEQASRWGALWCSAIGR